MRRRSAVSRIRLRPCEIQASSSSGSRECHASEKSGRLASWRVRIGGETFGGFERRGVGPQELIGVGQFEDAVNHAGSAGEAKQATRSFQTGKTIDEFSEAAAVELGNLRKINNDMPLFVAKQLIEGELQLLAFDAHLQGAAQLEDYDAGLQLFLVDQQRNLPFVCKILK